MSNKYVLLLLSFGLLYSGLNGEIINRSALNRKVPPMKMSRDLFSPKLTKREFRNERFLRREEELKIKEEKLKQKHEETFDKIIYEGYVKREHGNLGLLSINGEFVTARKGDLVLEKIEIVDINVEVLKIKMENREYEIRLKESEDEE